MVSKRFTIKVLNECLTAAEADVDRYKAAWMNLRAEADQRQHQLQAELDRNKELSRRVYELETELSEIRGGAL